MDQYRFSSQADRISHWDFGAQSLFIYGSAIPLSFRVLCIHPADKGTVWRKYTCFLLALSQMWYTSLLSMLCYWGHVMRMKELEMWHLIGKLYIMEEETQILPLFVPVYPFGDQISGLFSSQIQSTSTTSVRMTTKLLYCWISKISEWCSFHFIGPGWDLLCSWGLWTKRQVLFT